MLPPDPKKLLQKPASDATPDHAPAGPGAYPEQDAQAGPPAALSGAPSLGTLAQAFRRCWRLAVPLALLGALLAGAVAWVLVPPQFTSAATFRLSSRSAAGLGEEETAFANVQKSQIAFLKSFEVVDEAIKESRVDARLGVVLSTQAVQKKLVADFNGGPEILRVSFPHEDPEVAAALLKGLAAVYPRKIQDQDNARVRERIEHLRKRIYGEKDPKKRRQSDPTSLVDQLAEKRGELAAREKDKGIDDPETVKSKFDNAMSQLAGAQRDVRDLKGKIGALEGELASRQKRARNPEAPAVTDAEVEEYLSRSPEYQKLQAALDLKMEEIDHIRANAARGALRRALEQPLDELKTLERRQKALIEANRDKVAERLRGQQAAEDRKAITELVDRIEQSKKQLRAAQLEERGLRLTIDGLRAGGPKAPPEVEKCRDEVKLMEKELGQVGGQLATLEGSLPLAPRVSTLTEPFVPLEREYSRPLKFAVAAMLGAFGLVLVGMCLLESRSRRVYASGDVTAALGLPVVGTLPRLPAAQRAVQGAGGNPPEGQWGMVESIDAIRTLLLHSPRLDGLRVVMVTSAVGGEGKTTLASHLAASLSRAWRKTLLIDGDLRNPAAHAQFGLPLEPGLCEVLRGEVEFDDAVKPTQVSRLWLLPAGKVDGHALQALAQDAVGDVFARLKEQYDFIVLDTSPVLPVPDALLLGQHADAVLLSVLRDVSRVPAVWSAQQKLEALGIRTLGAVVIGEKAQTYGHVIPYPRKS